MAVGWVYHERFLEHDTGPSHPERPDRLRAVVKGLTEAGLLERMRPLPAAPVDATFVSHLHDEIYVRRAASAFERGERQLDPDTPISEHSYDIALLAAGGVVGAARAVARGEVQRAFCAVRPPGHHAERDRAMGFCLFNNIALAADTLIREHQMARVAIVDFDVHHGNGTQHLFEQRADVLFISIHEDPRYLYPGTGYATEAGEGPGKGFTLNVPMMPRTADAEWLAAFDEKIIPKLDEYEPQCLLVSAGFDAAKEDPLAHIELTSDGFEQITRRLAQVAERHCGGKIVSTLEGGYDLAALARCAAAHVRALLA